MKAPMSPPWTRYPEVPKPRPSSRLCIMRAVSAPVQLRSKGGAEDKVKPGREGMMMW